MIIVGEKLNGFIKSVAKAIRDRNADFIRDLAAKQLERRADYIDICSGVADKDAEVLAWMIELIQADHPDVRFSIDSPNPDSILTCMGMCRNPGMINSVTLETGKADKLFSAAAENKDWNVIALLLDNTGMPETVEKRMENFEGIMAKAKQYGIAEQRLYIDPLVFSVATIPESFLDFTGASKQIRDAHPDIHIISGLSNISFGLPYRKAINQAFLIGAMMNGMDSVILDPLSRDMMGGVYAAEALLGIDEYCIEYLDACRDDLFGNMDLKGKNNMKKLKLRRSARKDSARIIDLVYEHYFKIVPAADGFKDEKEMICKKITDEDGNIIAGCIAYIYQWGCLFVDVMWVDEKYRLRELGSNLLQAVEEAGKGRGCYLSYLDTADFQAKPFYLKHGYTVFGTVNHDHAGFEDYSLFKRLDNAQTKRPCKPIGYEIADGNEADSEYIDNKLDEYNLPFLKPKHDYIKINRKLIDENGNVVAAIMAGVSGTDDGWIWKIWVNEDHRDQGLGSLLLKHFEKKAKEKGATKLIVEEVYDWNVGFFLKNGYKVAGVLSDLPKGHSYYIVEKSL